MYNDFFILIRVSAEQCTLFIAKTYCKNILLFKENRSTIKGIFRSVTNNPYTFRFTDFFFIKKNAIVYFKLYSIFLTVFNCIFF